MTCGGNFGGRTATLLAIQLHFSEGVGRIHALVFLLLYFYVLKYVSQNKKKNEGSLSSFCTLDIKYLMKYLMAFPPPHMNSTLPHMAICGSKKQGQVCKDREFSLFYMLSFEAVVIPGRSENVAVEKQPGCWCWDGALYVLNLSQLNKWLDSWMKRVILLLYSLIMYKSIK